MKLKLYGKGTDYGECREKFPGCRKIQDVPIDRNRRNANGKIPQKESSLEQESSLKV